MKIPILVLLVVSVSFGPILSDAHQSGCHRWHSCPSDSGSYTCGDLGYTSGCPSYSAPKSEPKVEQPKYIQPSIPSWIKNSAEWWTKGAIDDKMFVQGIQYLVKEDILKIPPTTQGTNYGTNQIPTWVKNNAEWWAAGQIDDKSFITGIQFLIQEGIVDLSEKKKCSGNARCITGTVSSIIDGDTIKVDGNSIRFALSSAPELDDGGGTSAKKFIENLCPVGSLVTVDEDDLQTNGSYGRILGVIYCNGVNLNQELVESEFGYILSGYCSFSEFSGSDWARNNGC